MSYDSKAETYFVHPPSKSSTYEHAILILTDVIGHRFPNVQLIADQFAANGYLVAVPDLFHGDPFPLNGGWDMGEWRSKHGMETVDPIVAALVKELRTKYGVKKLGTVGYCFGARPVVRFLKKGLTNAAFVAHPSWVQAEELRAIEAPLSIAAAGKAFSSFRPRRSS
jgi:dienelactone hydrolase